MGLTAHLAVRTKLHLVARWTRGGTSKCSDGTRLVVRTGSARAPTVILPSDADVDGELSDGGPTQLGVGVGESVCSVLQELYSDH